MHMAGLLWQVHLLFFAGAFSVFGVFLVGGAGPLGIVTHGPLHSALGKSPSLIISYYLVQAVYLLQADLTLNISSSRGMIGRAAIGQYNSYNDM